MAGWEWTVIAGLAALGLALALALLTQMRRSGQGDAATTQTLETLQRAQIEMTGRLSQLAEASNIAQAELGRTVNSRLDALSKVMAESQNNVQLQFAKAMNASLAFTSASHGINVQKVYKVVLAKDFDLKCTLQMYTGVGEPVLVF